MMNKIFIIGLIVLFFGSISFAQNNRQNDSLINFVILIITSKEMEKNI